MTKNKEMLKVMIRKRVEYIQEVCHGILDNQSTDKELLFSVQFLENDVERLKDLIKNLVEAK